MKSVNYGISVFSLNQRTLTIGENIFVRLTSCLTCLDLTKQVKLLFNRPKQSS